MRSVTITLYRHILRDFKKLNPHICMKKGIMTLDEYTIYSNINEKLYEYEYEKLYEYDYLYDDECKLNIQLPIVYKDKYMNALSFLKYSIKTGDESDMNDLFHVYKNIQDYSDDIESMII